MSSKVGWASPFTLTALACTLIGGAGFLLGLTNATNLALSEKGYYLTLLAFGLYAAISVQKNIRDAEEGIPVSSAYSWASYAALALALALLVVGLVNATLALSEKGYYGMSFLLALFSAIAFQKQLRDTPAAESSSGTPESI